MNIDKTFAVEMKNGASSLDVWSFLNRLTISVVPKSDIKWLSIDKAEEVITVRPLFGEVIYEGIERVQVYNPKIREDCVEFSSPSFKARFYNKA